MNEHEKDRIAAAFNQLRPDWPLKSIRTLLDRDKLAIRPRRDVVVALGWVACEANTATPARVLEDGPWWKAASLEGLKHARRHPSPADACHNCGREFTGTCCDNPTQQPAPSSSYATHAAQARELLHPTTKETTDA